MGLDRDIDPGAWRRMVTRWVNEAVAGYENGYATRIAWDGGMIRVNYAGGCLNPVIAFWRCRAGDAFTIYKRRDLEAVLGLNDEPTGEWEPYTRHRHLQEPLKMDQGATVAFPCRKCLPCQQSRKRQWVTRAIKEIEQADRTWFVTLTFNDSWFVKCQVLGEEPHKAAVREAQRYYKRLRKNYASLRHMTVTELGTRTERLHLHALIHTTTKLQKRHLESQWHCGFTAARLVDKNSAFALHRASEYVAKYLTKSAVDRVKASIKYGSQTILYHNHGVKDKDPSTAPHPLLEGLQGEPPGSPALASDGKLAYVGNDEDCPF